MATDRPKATIDDLVVMKMHGYPAQNIQQAQLLLGNMSDANYAAYLERRLAVYPVKKAVTKPAKPTAPEAAAPKVA